MVSTMLLLSVICETCHVVYGCHSVVRRTDLQTIKGIILL